MENAMILCREGAHVFSVDAPTCRCGAHKSGTVGGIVEAMSIGGPAAETAIDTFSHVLALADAALELNRQLAEVKKLAGRWQEAALTLAPVTAGAIAFDPGQPEAWVAAIRAQTSPAFEAALRWHENGKHVSPTAPSVAHTTAILDHFGYRP